MAVSAFTLAAWILGQVNTLMLTGLSLMPGQISWLQ